MSAQEPLFRREALEYVARDRPLGGLLRIGGPWLHRSYWVVLALILAGLAIGMSVRTELTASGPALVDPERRTFVAALPATDGLDLDAGRRLRIELDASPEAKLPARVLRAEAAEPAAVRRAGLGSVPEPAILVTGVVVQPDGAWPSSRMARAVVPLGRQRLLKVFLRGFGEVL